MHYPLIPQHRPCLPRQQQGVALFVVIVFVMLAMLLALWASRSSLLNEIVVGNDADYQRAFEAAQSLIQDAELDIQRTEDSSHRAGKAVLPIQTSEIGETLNALNVTPFCKDGLCVKRRGRQDFWNNSTNTTEDDNPEVSLSQMATAGVGARYGEFTGATFNNPDDDDAPVNRILADRSAANRGGWYWIETLKYADSSSIGGSGLIVSDDPATTPADILDLRLNPSVVYRITALAYGLRPNTMAVIQETYARTRLQD